MKLIIVTVLLLVGLLSISYAPSRDFDTRLKAIVKPHLFSIIRWELKTIPHEVYQWLFGQPQKVDDEINVVTEYFSAIEPIKTLKSAIKTTNTNHRKSGLDSLETEQIRLDERQKALVGTVERVVEKQIRDTLTEQGIFNPLVGLKVNFPPLNFKLEKPPYLLVISPREKIESMREITLKPSLVLEEREDIEGGVDELGVSSLVLGLGGLAVTYPTLVNNEASLRSTIDTTAEEWLHQYLVFKPLGFLYLLDVTGLSRNYEIAMMNETLAGMVSQEIGTMVYKKYYSAYESSASQNQTAESAFDFNREMREIRKAVDTYLARGEIEKAEQFMEQKRQSLAAKGYYIRKLNQAYFAFYGTYADKAAFSSPIGLELKQLRSQSTSLKDFLSTVATMTSRQHLKDSLQ